MIHQDIHGVTSICMREIVSCKHDSSGTDYVRRKLIVNTKDEGKIEITLFADTQDQLSFKL